MMPLSFNQQHALLSDNDPALTEFHLEHHPQGYFSYLSNALMKIHVLLQKCSLPVGGSLARTSIPVWDSGISKVNA
jgi:hypothetical protein